MIVKLQKLTKSALGINRDAIKRIHENKPVSPLFETKNKYRPHHFSDVGGFLV